MRVGFSFVRLGILHWTVALTLPVYLALGIGYGAMYTVSERLGLKVLAGVVSPTLGVWGGFILPMMGVFLCVGYLQPRRVWFWWAWIVLGTLVLAFLLGKSLWISKQ